MFPARLLKDLGALRGVLLICTLGLIVLALLKPVASSAPADLSTLLSSVPMDAYYLGFLPVLDMWGSLIFWGLAILLGGSLFLLPWIARGRDIGPVEITDPKCNGCTMCYAECPYDAIRMVDRDDDSGFKKLAVVNPAQCTACAICVGACPTDAMQLRGGYNGEQTFNAVKGALHREKQGGHPVTVLFASQRDLAMGSLPAKLRKNIREGEPVSTSECGAEARLVTAILPSIGAVNIEWIRSLREEGARDIVLLSPPYDDAQYREDPHWMLNRLHLRPALVQADLHWLEVSPGDAAALEAFMKNLQRDETQHAKTPKPLPPVKERHKLIPSLVSGLVGTLILLGAFALALPLDVKAGMQAARGSVLRIALDAKGKIEAANIPPGVVLPEGADPVKIFGGVHFPISVRVIVDGETVLEDTYEPSGISGNGRISALTFLEIAPGTRMVEIWMRDDSEEYRLVFSGEIAFEQGRALILAYNEATDTFVLR